MVTWSRDYNEFVSNKHGDGYLDNIRNKSIYYFPTNKGIRSTRYFCELYDAKNVLDYGSGESNGIVAPKDVSIAYYDPFVASRKTKPNSSFDIVFLNHVLNGVEPDFLEEVLEEVKGLCNKSIVCLIRIPGMYNLNRDDYYQKFKRRGLIIKDEYLCSIVHFMIKLQVNDFNNPPRKTTPKEENALFYVLLEKDPNF